LQAVVSAPGRENSSRFGPPSKDLIRIVAEIRTHSNAPILDAGCGYGRNALAFAARGLSVVCVDQNVERLNALLRFARTDLRRPGRKSGQLHLVLADLSPSQWPFREHCFAGIVCVHFLDVGLFPVFQSSLVPGGFLYIETFGGHGGNYLDLPRAGQLHDSLCEDFHISSYRERKVGPARYDAVSVKLFALKRPPIAVASIPPHLWTSGRT
jgi:SAM-dependent methyltransferase